MTQNDKPDPVDLVSVFAFALPAWRLAPSVFFFAAKASLTGAQHRCRAHDQLRSCKQE